MHIVFAASECVPFAKTGGLADVVGALPPELARLGHHVTVYLPLYPSVRSFLKGATHYALRSVTVPFRWYNRFAGIVDGGRREGVQYYFMECQELFDRPALYGENGGEYPDNAERFAFFCRAVLEATKQLGVPHVFHVHDWQGALIPVYLKTTYAEDPAFAHTSSVITIHNAGYQGWFPPQTIEQLLFPWDLFTMDKVEQFDTFNFLKGGLIFADKLTTVSRKYAEEIQTPEFGEQLDGVLSSRKADLVGILNGIDYSQWDPATDRHLIARYTPAQLDKKRVCRADLLECFGLEKSVAATTPVLGIISRFAPQKGFEMLEAIIEPLMERKVALVALGSGSPHFEEFFRNLAARLPHKVGVRIGYDNVLAHKCEAGSDIFLMPSRYEPCGLNQIYSLKYGTVPVVRATGGLDDTIEEWNPERGSGTGFKFEGYEPGAFLDAIDRALAAHSHPKSWKQLMLNGMGKNYGWNKPAREYSALYEKMARQRG